ncbi:hypothetical protein ACFVUS_09065 [Nocardia sp. NPDC058058]|uniref:hypothetical protein n=1 Tax=Nocardia sp. NPDC058058 TaxID=3346317 RepID=UPI0036D77BA6
MVSIAVSGVSSEVVREYRDRGWNVDETSGGPRLVTDERIAAVELTGPLAAGVRRFLRANNLSGPVIEVRGAQRREIHLVVGAGKAAKAIEALRASGAVVYTEGATVPLPASGGAAEWGIGPDEARWMPPLVAISAAVRAAESRYGARVTELAC